MKKDTLKTALKSLQGWTIRNQPEILTGLGMAGVVLTAYQAYKAGPVIDKIMKEQKTEMALVKDTDTKVKREVTLETSKRVAIAIAPTILSGGVTMGCILGANRASSRRIAALSAAYSISETALKDLNEKLEASLGEKKVQKIKEEMSGEKLKKREPIDSNQVIVTGNGDVLCMDLYTGTPFYSNAEKIKQAINELSYRVISDMYVSLNELYELLGIPQKPCGEDFGWNIDDTIKGTLPITLCAQLTEDNKPCLCMDYNVSVRADFRNLH